VCQLPRRRFLTALTGLAATRKASAKAPQFIDWQDPATNVVAATKTMGDTSGKRTYSWSSGRVFGLVPGEVAKPLFQVEAASANRFEELEHAVFRRYSTGVTFFKDVENGKVLDHWRNPYTDAIVEPIHYFVGPTTSILTPTGYMSENEYRRMGAYGGATPFKWKWTSVGRTTWASRDVFRKTIVQPQSNVAPATNEEQFDVLTEFMTYQAPTSQLEDPNVTSADSTVVMTAQFGWYPWMFMSSRPGSLFMNTTGKKVSRLEMLPKEIIMDIDERWPGALTKPESVERRPSTSEMMEAQRQRRLRHSR